jgi:hypothetical protein
MVVCTILAIHSSLPLLYVFERFFERSTFMNVRGNVSNTFMNFAGTLKFFNLTFLERSRTFLNVPVNLPLNVPKRPGTYIKNKRLITFKNVQKWKR